MEPSRGGRVGTAVVGSLLVTVGAAAAAAPAPGAAAATITVGGKKVPLTHAVAFNAGARIYLLVTNQPLPPDQVKSEFELGMYKFQHRIVGLQLTLDSSRKVTEAAYMWEVATKPCPGCFDVVLSGGPEGPITGTVKSTPKAAEAKVELSGEFSAPFARPSGAKD